MSKFDQEIGDALESIKENGLELPIRRGSGDEDPVTGEVSNTVEQTGTIWGVVFSAKSIADGGNHDRDRVDGPIRTERRSILAAASGAPFNPQSGDRVEVEGKTWEVTGSTPLAPDGTPIIHKMEVQIA